MFKKKKNLPEGPSPLYPMMEKFVRDEWEKLDRDRLTKWAFFNVDNAQPIPDFHNRPISMGRGTLVFEGQIRDIFWKFADPFLEDIAVRTLDEVVKRGQGKCDLRQPIRETEGLLISYSRKAYARMADIDRRLRGKGYPQSVPLRETKRESGEMESYIARLADAHMRLLEKPKRWWQDETVWKRFGWVAGILGALGAVAKLLTLVVGP